ncbi:MAG TPA: hemolysin family protein [Gemmatimonadaceae bacterium]|nr:hemolysin family protein [Gemmatimonadaceae bacterium]
MSAILALVLLNGFFVAAEFALVRSRRTRLEAMVRTGDRFARIALRATSNISRVLSASQLGVTLASLGLGWLAVAGLADVFEGMFARMPFAVGLSIRVTIAGIAAYAVLTYLHVVLGELTPKAAALNSPERLARLLAPPLMLFAWVMSPFIWVLHRSADLLLKLLGQPPAGAEDSVHSPEELRILVEQAQEGGSLQQGDAEMIEAVFEFSEKNAREVMTPRTAIVGFEVDATLAEVVGIVEESGFSRYPVYEESIDDITGLVLAKDLLKVLLPSGHAVGQDTHGDGTPAFSLRTLMRPVHVIPGSREVEEVLADFKRLKEHMAIVLDEYGGTAGVVTMEDLLEEIVGEILDEYDTPEDDPEPVLTRAGETLVSGSTNIGELNDHFGLSVPDEDATTIGGYVFGVLGRLPVGGDRVFAGGAIFTVRKMEGRKIDSLAVDLHSAGDRRSSERAPQSVGTEATPR